VPHCDPEVLSLRALGEPAGTSADDDHLRSCAVCQAELDQLRAVVAASRSITPEDRPTRPPDHVWDRISDELGLNRGAESGAEAPVVDIRAGGRPREGVRGSWVRRRTAGLLAAAAALVGVLVGGGSMLLLDRGSPAPPTGSVVARAELDPLPTKQASGEATVAQVGTQRSLEIRVTGLPSQPGFYEVWLLNREANKLISLGVISGDRATIPLPHSVNLREYPVVDVSLEPYDGDPAHSTDSYVRGVLAL
jgi:hypothetical protein